MPLRSNAGPNSNVNLLEDMKKIEAIIKPFKLDEVREALIEIGVEGVTVSEVKMLGRHADHADHTAISRTCEYFSEFLPKLKFEIVVADNRVRSTIRAILNKARTGRINDGRVFVVPIQEAIRIRTGECYPHPRSIGHSSELRGRSESTVYLCRLASMASGLSAADPKRPERDDYE